MIREMGIDDIAQVVELEKECFKEPWGIDNVRYEIEGNPFSHGWILEQDGCIHAYAFLWETFETAQLAASACIRPDAGFTTRTRC